MKKITCIVFIASAVIFSCNKTGTQINKKELTGSWHLYAFGPPTSLPQTPADDNILVFEQSGKYSRITNNVLRENGFYNLSIDPLQNNDTVINFLPADTSNYKQLMYLRNDTLILVPLIITTDGYSLAYSRQ